MSIFIFSRPIHSGKTTELQQWCDTQKNILGILMPDINDSRKILNIESKEVFDIQCVDASNTTKALTTIGKYNFYTAAFEKGNSILLHAINQKAGWLVIDEAGKLELNRKGFYISVAEAVKAYDNTDKSGNLLITVRDSLCEEVIAFFNIKNYTLIDALDELT